ncbi:helix-turn-helix transcriptional regulator [Sporosarcina sp. FA9]|uniref:helix-turn-helix transcriptional regulator n=1 Tax=Sporosarcina sp. FA9 TaxID=3413030 RepID=UPI003F659765
MEKNGIIEKTISINELINLNEHQTNNLNKESFFTTEEKLLEHLFKLEKAEAQRNLRTQVASMMEYPVIEAFSHIKYYFIALSSIVARRLEKMILSPSKAFDFNSTCIILIENKLKPTIIMEFADELIEFYSYILTGKKNPKMKHHTVNDVIQYINSEIESFLTVEGIAKNLDISTSHLSRIFREHTKLTLVEYINIRKIEKSQYYLRFTDKKIYDISDQFHFCNQSYFTRIFKQYSGQTPKKFRSNPSVEYFRYLLPGEEM